MDPADTARAADADREAVAERLRIAAGEGRIDLEELDERLSLAYGAKTHGQLRALVVDLPVHPPSVPGPAAVPEPETLVLKTTTPNIRQSGQWVVPRRITAESTTGFITIDFRRASCAHREVTVEAATRTGWIRLILPDGWAARVDPSSTNTSHISNKAVQAADPHAPTIVMKGHPVFGYIKIKQRRRR
ncbi:MULTISPECIES: DUF1707 SHOCT-like domain-containing protein [Thermomonosporaceae]|uniref:DUF1707 SHOCT-like domain-containing protein n=1 Tax=Thermomonosporaceae TaxID=2012 RepID=UPI00255ABF8D|nr:MULTISPECIES: DUF1707 domain-containing protein [Thermomonosporaceae]MDL4777395.1 DUF1707 domain-containing protein [Actinomadura xylanilytica]